MTYTTLISAPELHELLKSKKPVMVFDCSFDLAKPDAGLEMYSEAHIPASQYIHLDHDLSAKTDALKAHAASGGRHPLPSRQDFASLLTAKGFRNDMQAVVLDRQGNNYCGRMWWMLKWMGHANVAVLDGGFQAWQAAGYPVEAAAPKSVAADGKFETAPALVKLVNMESVRSNLGKPDQHILDARATPRFKGEVEPIDPVAGHIPGALNRPFAQNMLPDGKFKPPATLRAEFEALLGSRKSADLVHHCGSGVSAVPNILAMQIAGFESGALFAGSWSEWSSQANNPVAQG